MKYVLAALLLAASFGVSATKNPPNPCGNHGNNCQPENGNGGDSSSSSSATGVGVGVGLGVGVGGSGGDGGAGGAGGNGGSGGTAFGGTSIASGGHGGDSSSAVHGSGNSANLNSNTAKGGSAHQGQSQGQSLNSANLLRMTSENTNKVNASSANSNNSQASGNTTVTNVGGDSTLVERNAPPVFLGAITPTSCGGSFQAGASDRNGSGAFGLSWVGSECAIRMIGDRYQQLGMVDTACEVYRSTKAFQKAVKRNPKLASLDCTIKPTPAPVPALVAPELAPRVPRG